MTYNTKPYYMVIRERFSNFLKMYLEKELFPGLNINQEQYDTHIEVVVGEFSETDLLKALDTLDRYNVLAKHPLFKVRDNSKYFKSITSFIAEGILFKSFLLIPEKREEFIAELQDILFLNVMINSGNFFSGYPLIDIAWKKDYETYAQSFKDSLEKEPAFLSIKNPQVLPEPYTGLVSKDDILFRWSIMGHSFYFKNAQEGTLGIPWAIIKYTDWEHVSDQVLPIKFGR